MATSFRGLMVQPEERIPSRTCASHLGSLYNHKRTIQLGPEIISCSATNNERAMGVELLAFMLVHACRMPGHRQSLQQKRVNSKQTGIEPYDKRVRRRRWERVDRQVCAEPTSYHTPQEITSFSSFTTNNQDTEDEDLVIHQLAEEVASYLGQKTPQSKGMLAVVQTLVSTISTNDNQHVRTDEEEICAESAGSHPHWFSHQGQQVAYVESCPNHVRLSCGVSFAAASKGWSSLQGILKWHELSIDELHALKLPVRQILKGKRYGRHVLLTKKAFSALVKVLDAVGYPKTNALVSGQANGGLSRRISDRVPNAIVEMNQIPMQGAKRTVHVRCPNRANHKHGDQNPSLVLWMNDDGITGGGQCMVCRDELDPGQKLTFFVEFHGKQAWLYTRAGNQVTKTRDFVMPNVEQAKLGFSESERRPGSPQQSTILRSDISPPLPSSKVRARKARSFDPHVPVGGYALSPLRDADLIASGSLVVAELRETIKNGNVSRERTMGTAIQGDVLEVLNASDKQSQSKLQVERALDIQSISAVEYTTDAEHNSFPDFDGSDRQPLSLRYPTKQLSVSSMKATAWKSIPGRSRKEKEVSIPCSWVPLIQSWILFDLDDVYGISDDVTVRMVASKLLSSLRRNSELSGRVVVVQTSPNGFQIWAELREPRSCPYDWLANPETRMWYLQLGDRLLGCLHKCGASGGIVDMSSCAAGRFGRRPGWRLLDDGKVFRSQIVAMSTTKVASHFNRMDSLVR